MLPDELQNKPLITREDMLQLLNENVKKYSWGKMGFHMEKRWNDICQILLLIRKIRSKSMFRSVGKWA